MNPRLEELLSNISENGKKSVILRFWDHKEFADSSNYAILAQQYRKEARPEIDYSKSPKYW